MIVVGIDPGPRYTSIAVTEVERGGTGVLVDIVNVERPAGTPVLPVDVVYLDHIEIAVREACPDMIGVEDVPLLNPYRAIGVPSVLAASIVSSYCQSFVWFAPVVLVPPLAPNGTAFEVAYAAVSLAKAKRTA